MSIYAVNWNKIEDQIDLDIWNRMTSQFWLPEKVAVSNDIKSWNKLSNDQKKSIVRVFAGLTRLDTLQGTVGALALLKSAVTPHEEANYTFISAMESIHAKSYSSIFSTLCTSKEIDDAFEWANNNELMNRKIEIIERFYNKHDHIHHQRMASVFLESALFYSGFYLPLWHASRGNLTNTADIIRLIIRDEALHGYYIGYKYQQGIKDLSQGGKEVLHNDAINLLMKLYAIELEYTDLIYNDRSTNEDVKKFINYNSNKALQNLGYNGIFPADICNVSPEVLSALAPASENHDFFSSSGSSYIMGKFEELSEDEWDF